MELNDIMIQLNCESNQKFNIRVNHAGPNTFAVYVNRCIYCYVTTTNDNKKKVIFAHDEIQGFVHDNDEYIVKKIISTIQSSKL